MVRSLVWFRRDLRVHDNPTLSDAVNNSDEVLPVYTFDPHWFDEGMFGMDRIGGYRARFLWESVEDLRSKIQSLGGDLIVRSGEATDVIPSLCDEHNIDTIYTQTMPSTQEIERERNVRKSSDAEFERYWSHTLYHLNDLESNYDSIDDTFTPWRKETQYGAEVRSTVEKPNEIPVPDVETGSIPSPEEFDLELKNSSDNGFVKFKGGESAGLSRMNEYIWEKDKLREYKETRNGLLGEDYSSKFSPWLAHGCLSPRRIYEEVQEYEDERVSNDSTYWLVFELMWRDFFQFQFLKHGDDFFTENGIRNVDYDWNQNLEAFRAWANGRTGFPFVDANMREINKTGYMSNRGRQNVASFLVDVLDVDWRMGAMYFQSKLVDYDVCSNWGNWAYQAGVGNDSRNNYFNVLKQGERYDDNGEYIRHWLTELEGLPADATHRPWKMSEGQQQMYGVELGEDYPEPIVDIENYSYKEVVENRLTQG